MRGCHNVSGGLLLTWPLDQRVPLVAVSCCSDQEDTQQGCWPCAHLCEAVGESVLLSTDSSIKKVLHIVWQNTDKRLISPLMIGNLVQPKPNDTLALMFQGFTETGVSSVKHLWPAGSHWQYLALPLPGDIKCDRTVSSADTRFYKHQVKQPHLCKPTNHPPPCVCLCRPNVMYSPALPPVYTDQTVPWAREGRRELTESWVTFG